MKFRISVSDEKQSLIEKFLAEHGIETDEDAEYVKKIRPALSMKYVLTMTNGTLVDVTRSYYSEFRKFFDF
ncbi:MAG: hypothetical protein IJL67_08100 [Oscillospiraceae bacterium]|nr:hypothetical protein [Oscillospiraceae bacterium]